MDIGSKRSSAGRITCFRCSRAIRRHRKRAAWATLEMQRVAHSCTTQLEVHGSDVTKARPNCHATLTETSPGISLPDTMAILAKGLSLLTNASPRLKTQKLWCPRSIKR